MLSPRSTRSSSASSPSRGACTSAPDGLQQGTFNANPLSAAAGTAMLRIVAQGQATAQAERRGQQLRDELNAVLRRRGAAGLTYGEEELARSVSAFDKALQRLQAEGLA